MTTSDLPSKFNRGDKLSAVHATEFARAAQRTGNVSVDPALGFDVQFDAQGLRFVRKQGRDLRQPRDITVVVTKEPADTDIKLTVRRVRHTDIPPKQCEGDIEVVCRYEWASDDFEAYPDFGFRAIDYKVHFWDPVTDGLPMLDTMFLKARHERNVWHVEKSAEGASGVEIVALVGASQTQLFAKTVERNEDGDPTIVGDLFVVWPWPWLETADYSEFLHQEIAIPVFTIDGTKYAVQQPTWEIIRPSGQLRHGNCQLDFR